MINGKVDAFVYDLPYNAIFAPQNQGAVVHLDKPFTLLEPLAWAIRKGDQDTSTGSTTTCARSGRWQLRPSLQEVVLNPPPG